jgi:hypothetical protein
MPFEPFKEQINLAFALCRGRVLEDPRRLICSEILHITPPEDFVTFGTTIQRYMDVARRADSKDDVLKNNVRYKQTLTQGRGRAGFPPSVVTELVAGPKREWRATVESMADQAYPEWRAHFDTTGQRLPTSLRKTLIPRHAWAAEREKFIHSFLSWVGASPDPQSIAETQQRLDAVVEFTAFVAREFLISNYSLETNASDVYDQFQLFHLAMDRFIIVTADRDLPSRTEHSTQADRIMSFDQFLQTL